MIYTSSIFLLIHIHVLYGDLTSYIDFASYGTDFIPANKIELRGTHLSVASAFDCALLCHQDPQCRTFVFDLSICQLYEGSSNTGSIIVTNSSSRMVGAINYSKINVAAAYNQSCNHCYPDRYLVCRNNTCQCPLDTFYDNEGNCMNQLFVDSTLSCENDNWCEQDMNLTCQCGKCQCPVGTFWMNKTCVPQFYAGKYCNTSDQCRNDLNLVCSRKNKTCIPMTIVKMPVMTGTLPSKFSYVDMSFNSTGEEWWRGFDSDITTKWNRYGGFNVLDYILVTFNDTYLLNSLQLTVGGDATHDPKTIGIYIDENGTCLAQSFSFPAISNGSFTFSVSIFNTTMKPLATKQVLISIERWSIFQTWLYELTFFGGLY
ncbi:unnamed protein product [Adineta steineri]|uniref:Apple domain-containing protein n=1 Tax=Adineta steineri TaxID=433720 RepID=A0A819IRE5_9BILA|nr:unnamed protein product [Adineta steineri]